MIYQPGYQNTNLYIYFILMWDWMKTNHRQADADFKRSVMQDRDLELVQGFAEAGQIAMNELSKRNT